MELKKYKISIYKRQIYVCDQNIVETNRQTIEYIDETYFEDMNGLLEREKIANRFVYYSLFQTYYSSLETMFSHLCAIIQAPYLYYAWIIKYKNEELCNMVRDISNNSVINNAYGIDSVSWDDVANIIHQQRKMKDLLGNIELFPLVWRKLAADFLNSDYREAYNSIKHGMRVKNNSIVSMSIGENVISGSDYGIDYIIIDEKKEYLCLNVKQLI